MRLRFYCVSLASLCSTLVAIAQTPTCADLHLVPAVRECSDVRSIPIGDARLSVSADRNADDEFAAEDLRQSVAGRPVAGKPAPTIRLLRLSAAARQLLARHHLTFDPPMHDEGYAIVPEENGIA